MNLQHAAVLCFFSQQVAIVSDINCSVGDNFLTNRVYWRVCNLGKHLLEIIEKRLVVV